MGRLVDRCSFSLQINDPGRNGQDAFQMEVHAARVASLSPLIVISNYASTLNF